MPVVKRQVARTPNAYVWDNVDLLQFATVSPAAGVANTTVQASILLPVSYKISGVAVACSAIDALTGDSFNIVVGRGAYTQGTVPPTDNSQQQTTAGIGGVGYTTVFAAAGQALFSADQALTATSGVGVASTTLEPALATPTTGSGGVWRFQTAVPDAVFPAGTLLTLRVVTNASTGSITNLVVSLYASPTMVRRSIVNAQTEVNYNFGVEY